MKHGRPATRGAPKKRAWTPAESGFLSTRHARSTTAELAQLLQRTEEDVLKQCVKLKLIKRPPRPKAAAASEHGGRKAGWRSINGIENFYRSKWEANYARFLEWQRQLGKIYGWEHEPETFWFEGIKRGTVSYLPDFRVRYADGRVEYHEVKGWMDPRSATKIARMAKYFPEVVLVVIDKDHYKALSRSLRDLVPGWE